MGVWVIINETHAIGRAPLFLWSMYFQLGGLRAEGGPFFRGRSQSVEGN